MSRAEGAANAGLDPRVTLARPDLAAAELEGRVSAERYVALREKVVCMPVAPVTATPDGGAGMTTQLLFGERVLVAEEDGHWAWVQGALDGYVGYVPLNCIDDPELMGAAAPSHRVTAVSTHVYPAPDFKSRPGGALSFGARLAVAEAVRGNQADFAALASGGFVPLSHVAPLAAPASDWVAEAERLVGVPYLWGGRSALGIDCSGLVQLALQAAGRDCPRDSDQQAAVLGTDLPRGAKPARGDLVFWKGHVGIMLNGTRLLHANIHHMAVAAEPLAAARRRIAAAPAGAVTRIARLDGEAPPD
ncbi:C40 family peptidase [Paralimibaculum aggregatum]|uniref:C40 family peptidase n=1 Tax=Paralimibaculum aggregatum TaxID=3036245 RepID=A0ABQ6LKF9_9RHOB|nr:NlpC/P60 family protein [Limibaculum sp. NKW23]GMG83733.1 C40 family peptidase [Limibaculum sp. NKW23]